MNGRATCARFGGRGCVVALEGGAFRYALDWASLSLARSHGSRMTSPRAPRDCHDVCLATDDHLGRSSGRGGTRCPCACATTAPRKPRARRLWSTVVRGASLTPMSPCRRQPMRASRNLGRDAAARAVWTTRNMLLLRSERSPDRSRSVACTGRCGSCGDRRRWGTARRPGPGGRPAPARRPPHERMTNGSCCLTHVLKRADIISSNLASQRNGPARSSRPTSPTLARNPGGGGTV